MKAAIARLRKRVQRARALVIARRQRHASPSLIHSALRVYHSLQHALRALRQKDSVRNLRGEALLVHLGTVAQNMGMQRLGWRGVTSEDPSQHAPGSYHNQQWKDGVGMAFDAAGSEDQHAKLVAYIKGNGFDHYLTEGIHNGTSASSSLSVKHGQTEAPSFWGLDTWANHRNHVHLAISPEDGPAR